MKPLKKDLLLKAKNLRTLVLSGHNCMGICYYLNIGNSVAVGFLLEGFFRRWPEFSGSVSYPVSSNKKIEPRDQYRSYRQKGELYSNTPYGRARRRLLDFIISELEKELSEK